MLENIKYDYICGQKLFKKNYSLYWSIFINCNSSKLKYKLQFSCSIYYKYFYTNTIKVDNIEEIFV